MTNETNLDSAIANPQNDSAAEELARLKGDDEPSEIEIFEISIDGMCGVY